LQKFNAWNLSGVPIPNAPFTGYSREKSELAAHVGRFPERVEPQEVRDPPVQ
jgi:hypothetical protein